ncbi:MAG: GIY-YIG nuclease family protein [Elusimicrobiota bacterium]
MRKINLSDIPHLPGVYIMKDIHGRIIYIGKAKDLRKRVGSYFGEGSKNFKAFNISLFIHRIDFIISNSEKEALLLERKLIGDIKPFFNTVWKDSKSYSYLAITKEDFPRIFFTRNRKINAYYFGPYPKLEIVRRFVDELQSIGLINLRRCRYNFSFKKPLKRSQFEKCIYYHTKQCPAPCDELRISKKEYKKLVNRAIDLFNGRSKKLIAEFKSKMEKAVANLEYEKAIKYRDFIKAINHIYERVSLYKSDIWDIESKLNMTNTLIELKKILHLKKIPYHIESFDISNLYNKWAVGGSVCFINGEKNYEHYRRYKIRFDDLKDGGNDYKMIYEVVSRRLKKALLEGEIPDLIIIDGGKGQLSMALKAADDIGVKVDIVSIAKKNEEIYLPQSSNPIILPKDSKELLFLISIRDETHRFAVSYHRKLRSMDFLI